MPTLEETIMSKLNVDTNHINYKHITRKTPKTRPIKDHYQILSNYFYQIDLMVMTPFNGYKYLFVVVNMRTRLSDAFPLKTKNAVEVTNAFRKMLERNVIEKFPKLIYSDQGSEFKNHTFESFCKRRNIKLIFTRVKSKNQNSIVEMTNNFYGKYLIKYLSFMWQQKNKVSNNWVSVLYTVRDELNKWCREHYPKHVDYFDMEPDLSKNNYNVGDFVYIKTDYPKRVLTEEKEHGYNFRHGDLRFGYEKHKITGVSRANGRNLRYHVEDSKGKTVFGSYLDHHLLKAGNITDIAQQNLRFLNENVNEDQFLDFAVPIIEMHYELLDASHFDEFIALIRNIVNNISDNEANKLKDILKNIKNKLE